MHILGSQIVVYRSVPKTMSFRASAHTAVLEAVAAKLLTDSSAELGIPKGFRYVSKNLGDCHTSDRIKVCLPPASIVILIRCATHRGHWFAMTPYWVR